jgi:hypothetical protein
VSLRLVAIIYRHAASGCSTAALPAAALLNMAVEPLEVLSHVRDESAAGVGAP